MTAFAQGKRSLASLRAEYDHLFRTEGIRDEERAYRWFARGVRRFGSSSGRLLDVACGGGYFLSALAREFAGSMKLVGVDISGEALALAARECPSALLYASAAEDLPFHDASFDAVTCLGSLEHFLDIGRALSEMRRVAKDSALFFILVPNIFWYKDILSVSFRGERLVRNQTHERFASYGEWKHLLEANGLRVLKAEKYNGIAKNSLKQGIKNLLIPLRFSYHFLFICAKRV